VDELALLQVDGDGDGVLDGTLYPVSDPWGSVEVLLDESGRLVERVETLPEGKPRIFGEDRKRPEVLRVVWTGNGQTPAGQVPAGVLELTLGEPMRAGSVAKARITLAGQEIAPEHVQLSENGRRVLVAASPVAGQQVTLRVEGLEDRSGNRMQPLEVTFALADSGQYQVLLDAAFPQVLAILDEGEGVSVLFDEPVVPAAGMELASAITVTRAGAPVEGNVTRISPWQLSWRPSESSGWLLGGEYRLSIAGLVELGPEQKPVSTDLVPVTFTHLASGSERMIVASQPPETPPRASSAFGNTTLFQGRLWVPELGLYSYRARWCDPQLVNFIERDPIGYHDSPNLYQALNYSPVNFTDPFGEWFVIERIMTPHRIVTPPRGDPLKVKVISRLYTNSGQLLHTMIGLAQGASGRSRERRYKLTRRNPSTGNLEVVDPSQAPEYGTRERRALRNGDTPFGVYLSGRGKPGIGDVFEVDPIDPNTGKRDPAYGRAKVYFEPMLMEAGAEANGRDLIREHGGGSGLTKSGEDPFADCQRLTPTYGCMRFYNIDMLHRVEAIQKAQAIDGYERGIFVVGDDHFLLLMAYHPRLRKAWRENRVFEKTGLHYIDLVRFLTLNFDYPWPPDLFTGPAPEPNPTPTAPR